MEVDYDYYRVRHIPAFGSWNWNEDRHFTQCFQSARQARFLPCSNSDQDDHDLYVTGDLYENHLVTPAMIVVPRPREKTHETSDKEGTIKGLSWVVRDVKEPPSVVPSIPKPVDEDLYKISPELLYPRPKKKRRVGFISSCFLPTCVP